MNIQYGNNKIKKQLSSASEIKKAFGVLAKKVNMRLEEIKASPNLAGLMQIPACNCHRLFGDRAGEWAVTISGNDRMIFEIKNDPIPLREDKSINTVNVTDIKIIEIVDYH
jgi:plasmid maintenance system killer protein